MKKSKIAIIGAGNVGSTIAYSCMLKNLTAEIMLVDINDEFCKGQVIDLCDALAFSKTSCVTQGTLKKAAQSDTIIICAGSRQKPGQSRIDLLQTNKQVIASIFEQMKPIKKDAVIIMVTNPVDILTLYAQQIADHEQHLIFGSGTLLDTQRLKGYIAQKINVAPESVDTYMLGEHGDTAFAAFSAARIAGNPLSEFNELGPNILEEIEKAVRKKAYDIIQCKGSTYFGIGACVAMLCKSIMFDEKEVFPVSFYHPEHQICFSLPAAIGAQGIEKEFEVPLNESEKQKLVESINKIKKDISQ